MRKTYHSISLAINSVLFVGSLLVIFNLFFHFLGNDFAYQNGWQAFTSFDVVANVILVLASLLTLICDIVAIVTPKETPWGVRVIKLLAVTSLLTGFLIAYVYIFPFGSKGDIKEIAALGDTLWLRTVFPIVALVSYLLFENETKVGILSSLFTLIPGAIFLTVIFTLAHPGKIEPIYLFLDPDAEIGDFWFLWGIIPLFVTFLLGFCIIPLRNKLGSIMNKTNTQAVAINFNNTVVNLPLIQKETIKKEEKEKEEPVKEEPLPPALETPVAEQTPTEEELIKAGPRVYHITKSTKGDNFWQVKLANGKRRVKKFTTQQAAIDYAKKLVERYGGSIRIHSVRGKIRKEK